MGPPIFIGGKARLASVLVWPQGASMGPPIFIGGKAMTELLKNRDMIASMGPPIFIGGKVVNHIPIHPVPCLASMGPPIFIGGKFVASQNHGATAAGFNGAADFYRRKGHKMRSSSIWREPGFNGAADFYRRKD